MHIVTWNFEVMEGKNRDDLMLPIKGSASDYRNVPGLVRIYFGIAPDLKSVAEISLWETKADADRFFDADWDAETARRWESARMTRKDLDAPVVVDSAR